MIYPVNGRCLECHGDIMGFVSKNGIFKGVSENGKYIPSDPAILRGKIQES